MLIAEIRADMDPDFNGVVVEGFLCGNYIEYHGCLVHQELIVKIGMYTLILVQALRMYQFTHTYTLSYKSH